MTRTTHIDVDYHILWQNCAAVKRATITCTNVVDTLLANNMCVLYCCACNVLLQHVFCEDCLCLWFDRERTCPLCRSTVIETPRSWKDGTTSAHFQIYWAHSTVHIRPVPRGPAFHIGKLSSTLYILNIWSCAFIRVSVMPGSNTGCMRW